MFRVDREGKKWRKKLATLTKFMITIQKKMHSMTIKESGQTQPTVKNKTLN